MVINMPLRIEIPVQTPGVQPAVYTPDPSEVGKPTAQLEAMKETMDALTKVQRDEEVAEIKKVMNAEETFQY